jgi:hypothetical protein
MYTWIEQVQARQTELDTAIEELRENAVDHRFSMRQRIMNLEERMEQGKFWGPHPNASYPLSTLLTSCFYRRPVSGTLSGPRILLCLLLVLRLHGHNLELSVRKWAHRFSKSV